MLVVFVAGVVLVFAVTLLVINNSITTSASAPAPAPAPEPKPILKSKSDPWLMLVRCCLLSFIVAFIVIPCAWFVCGCIAAREIRDSYREFKTEIQDLKYSRDVD